VWTLKTIGNLWQFLSEAMTYVL